MTFTVTTDSTIWFIGCVVLAWVAGNVGSALGIIITAIHTPALDGQKAFTVIGMLGAVAGMQAVKIPVAVVALVASQVWFPDSPLKAASWICFALGCALMTGIGIVSRKG